MSNDTKQTAVEWYNQQIVDKQNGNGDSRSFDEIFEQAKEMEKEQIIDGFGVGCQVESTRLIGYHKMAAQYYNETYGGNK